MKKNSAEMVITVEEPLPSSVRAGDAVENADFYPSVVFRNNIVRNNRARGSLFTTPERVLVEGNLFDHSSGSARSAALAVYALHERLTGEDPRPRNVDFRLPRLPRG